MKPADPVAATGLSCICAAGRNLAECVDSLFSASPAPPKPPERISSDHEIKFPVFEIPADWVEAKGDGMLSRTSALALAAAAQALDDAKLNPAGLRGARVGVCMGTTVGSAMNDEEFYRQFRLEGSPSMLPIERYLASNPASVIAREYGLSGPLQTVVNACSSGTDAAAIGASWIRQGLCDAAIVGGADELCRVTYNGFISLMITSPSHCKPFDAGRKGLNLGEGAAAMILESAKFRRARKRRAKAFILGYGTACDAHHLTAPHPDGTGLRRSIAAALETSGKRPEDIAFVNAHGTGTKANDKVESCVLKDFLPEVPFFSTKAFTGHTLGAAGAVEAAFTVACLERGEIPASRGFAEPDPELPSQPVSKPTRIHGDAAISQSLAFGGNNGVIVLGRGES